MGIHRGGKVGFKVPLALFVFMVSRASLAAIVPDPGSVCEDFRPTTPYTYIVNPNDSSSNSYVVANTFCRLPSTHPLVPDVLWYDHTGFDAFAIGIEVLSPLIGIGFLTNYDDVTGMVNLNTLYGVDKLAGTPINFETDTGFIGGFNMSTPEWTQVEPEEFHGSTPGLTASAVPVFVSMSSFVTSLGAPSILPFLDMSDPNAGVWASTVRVNVADFQDVSAVPVPAAVWLYGFGLLGLAGMARRKM